MIETYFGLLRRPFLAVPDVHSYFPSEAMELARTNTLRCLDRGEGISLIFGSSGIGKSLLLRLLGLPFQLEYPVALISNHRLKSPKAFLQQVLFELQQPFCGSEENELRLFLWDHLRRSSFPGVILLIDEGQTISLSVLEEIRMMLNCDNGSTPKFRIAIAGTPELEERLTHHKLKTFNQWIVSRSYLEPFTRSETAQYILWQSKNAKNSTFDEQESGNSKFNGWHQGFDELDAARKKIGPPRMIRVDPAHHHDEAPVLFDSAACEKIHHYTQGVPRLINQLCDHALVLMCENENGKIVTESAVKAAWSSLQQIPDEEMRTFFSETASTGSTFSNSSVVENAESADAVVEFGTLEDTVEEQSEEIVRENIEESIVENEMPEHIDVDCLIENPDEEETEIVTHENPDENISWNGPLQPLAPQPWSWSDEEKSLDTSEIRYCAQETKTKEFPEQEIMSDPHCDGRNDTLQQMPQTGQQVQTIENCHESNNAENKNALNRETKSSDYVYQTKTFYESAYPNGPESAMSNWAGSGHQIRSGCGTSYREVMLGEEKPLEKPQSLQHPEPDETVRNRSKSCDSTPLKEVVLPLEMEISGTKTGDPRMSLPGFLEFSNACESDLVAIIPEKTSEKGKTDENIGIFAPVAHPIEYSIPDSLLNETEETVRKEEVPILRLHLQARESETPGERQIFRETFEEEIPIPKTKISASGFFELDSRSSRILVRSPEALSREIPCNNENDKDALELLQQTLLRKVKPDSAQRIAALLSDTLSPREDDARQKENETETGNPVNDAADNEKYDDDNERMTIRFDTQNVASTLAHTKTLGRHSKKITKTSEKNHSQNEENVRKTILPLPSLQERSALKQQSNEQSRPNRSQANPDLRSKGKHPMLKLRRPTDEGVDAFEDVNETTASIPITEKKTLDLGSLFSQAYR